MSEPTDLFDASAYAQVRRPLLEASNLPGRCYTSARWYAREMAAIFRVDWLFVGRVEQVAKPGDFFTLQIADEPIVVVRDLAGQIRAHLAICRHRGALVADGSGNCNTFSCPYHGWVYRLTGELIGTPGRQRPMEAAVGFDRRQHGLISIRIESWGGFLFVNFDPDAPPLREWLGDLPSRLANYRMEDLVCTRAVTHDIDCNWKVYVENATDEYHVEFLHRRHMSPDNPNLVIAETPGGPYTLRHNPHSITAPADGPLPGIPGLTGKQLVGAYSALLFPNLYLMLSPTVVKYLIMHPLAVEQCRITIAWCFPKAAIEAPGFEEIARERYYGLTDPVVGEDNSITPSVQRGLRSPSRPSGRFSVQEYGIHAFENYVLDRILAVEPETAASR
ncbi:MAG: aromatic ring-hydroxylating dioxygenase subunit alpha [Lautropia sp.]